MTHLKYIIIVFSSMLLSCTQKEVNSKADQIQTEVDSIEPQDLIQSSHKKDSTTAKGVDDSGNTIKSDQLKVIIDGKDYFKKNTTDFRLGDSFIFRTKDNRSDYDIRTGRFVPSGHNAGKVSTP